MVWIHVIFSIKYLGVLKYIFLKSNNLSYSRQPIKFYLNQ